MGTQPAGKPELRFDGEWERIELEAARWLIIMDGEPSLPTQRALHHWLSARPRHRAAFLRLSVAWRRMDRLRVYPAGRPSPRARSVPSALRIIVLTSAALVVVTILAIWITISA